MCYDGQGGPSGPDGSCGPYGLGDNPSQGGPGGQVVRWSDGQMVRVVRVRKICFQKIYGFHALNHQIIEKS